MMVSLIIEDKNSEKIHLKIDGFIKSLTASFDVIPAKAGIQCFQIVLDACLRRHDGISDFLRVCQNSGLNKNIPFQRDLQLVDSIFRFLGKQVHNPCADPA